jgi:hypothetical protein
MDKILTVIKSFLSLVSDTNSDGKRKISIGRAPLLVVLVTMCYQYITKGTGPDTGILTFVGMAMAYNGFSKTKLTQGDGGNNDAPVAPSEAPNV